MLIELKEKLYDVAPGIALNELEPGISMYHCIGGDEVRVVNNAVVPPAIPIVEINEVPDVVIVAFDTTVNDTGVPYTVIVLEAETDWPVIVSCTITKLLQEYVP